ncbi:unnamed protein product [Caenorhabditis angaria]|uniref:Uncharacterized protein n=1 Tax=Caenorhabditis angaria TaxID=860376 RepID=A0A9P1J3W5_9PELO|nr:unnamed protein product [Caenorhabditis angaria]
MNANETYEVRRGRLVNRFPSLILIQEVGLRQAVSFMFFSTVFLISTSQNMGLFEFTAFELVLFYTYALFLYTIVIMCLRRAILIVRAMFVIPILIVLATLVSFNLMLFAALFSTLLIHSEDGLLFCWHTVLTCITIFIIVVLFQSMETISTAVMNLFDIQKLLDVNNRRRVLIAVNRNWNSHYDGAQRRSRQRVRFQVVSTPIY